MCRLVKHFYVPSKLFIMWFLADGVDRPHVVPARSALHSFPHSLWNRPVSQRAASLHRLNVSSLGEVSNVNEEKDVEFHTVNEFPVITEQHWSLWFTGTCGADEQTQKHKQLKNMTSSTTPGRGDGLSWCFSNIHNCLCLFVDFSQYGTDRLKVFINSVFFISACEHEESLRPSLSIVVKINMTS